MSYAQPIKREQPIKHFVDQELMLEQGYGSKLITLHQNKIRYYYAHSNDKIDKSASIGVSKGGGRCSIPNQIEKRIWFGKHLISCIKNGTYPGDDSDMDELILIVEQLSGSKFVVELSDGSKCIILYRDNIRHCLALRGKHSNTTHIGIYGNGGCEVPDEIDRSIWYGKHLISCIKNGTYPGDDSDLDDIALIVEQLSSDTPHMEVITNTKCIRLYQNNILYTFVIELNETPYITVHRYGKHDIPDKINHGIWYGKRLISCIENGTYPGDDSDMNKLVLIVKQLSCIEKAKPSISSQHWSYIPHSSLT